MVMFRALIACLILTSIMPDDALAQTCQSLATLQWLLGDWKAQDERSITLERWDQVSPATFEGRGEVIRALSGDSEGLETLRLVEMSGVVYYIASVSHNDQPVVFEALSCGETSATFANPEHDFPKRLVYRLDGDDRLIVDVNDGDSQGFSLEFLRQK